MTILSRDLLATRLKTVAETGGLHVVTAAPDRLTAERETSLGRWFLGGRKAVYRASCDLDEAAHDVRFREATTESSWGIPPPSLSVETTAQHGTRTTQSTTVRTADGGGAFNIGEFRQAVEAAAGEAGWQFHLEAGRRP
ncbi:MAG: hypothetical protein Q8L86_18025 [Vicinamibacterales bacterium]|nr:hypothetical protein [Vicinamibacterales bacterium]